MASGASQLEPQAVGNDNPEDDDVLVDACAVVPEVTVVVWLPA